MSNDDDHTSAKDAHIIVLAGIGCSPVVSCYPAPTARASPVIRAFRQPVTVRLRRSHDEDHLAAGCLRIRAAVVCSRTRRLRLAGSTEYRYGRVESGRAEQLLSQQSERESWSTSGRHWTGMRCWVRIRLLHTFWLSRSIGELDMYRVGRLVVSLSHRIMRPECVDGASSTSLVIFPSNC